MVKFEISCNDHARRLKQRILKDGSTPCTMESQLNHNFAVYLLDDASSLTVHGQ